MIEQWQNKENREFLRAGTIAAAALNPHLDRKRHPQALTAHDFFHLPRPPEPKPTPAQLKENASRIFGIHNARVRRLERGKKDRAG